MPRGRGLLLCCNTTVYDEANRGRMFQSEQLCGVFPINGRGNRLPALRLFVDFFADRGDIYDELLDPI